MTISIDPSIFQIEKNIKIGIIHYTKFTVSESPQMLKGRIRLYQEHLFIDLQDKELTEYQGIKEWRGLWKKFGSNPGRYCPSMEALMRRIRNQNYLQPFNSGVDLNNFFSLQFEIPIGLYDVSHIKGDINIFIGNSKTSLTGINGRDNNLNGTLTIQDELGPFGSPFIDSIRTTVNEDTVQALQIFFLKPSMSKEEAEKLLTSAGKMFVQVNGGNQDSLILDKQIMHTPIN
ncbi:B3/4 domain-containing protein [Paenisporosarcina sp. TG20]|uniref:B3/B4 domain-containing protein n=1 Tax=Paenisporosarcina sp. TG20 TaxID=1211706 RepID=UPI0002F43177|nr:phenylalanine--tRNA ligase beta subunit-related protein [Paenisporosarcina sp. TG20]